MIPRRPALFVDRDGVLVPDSGVAEGVASLRPWPRAVEALRLARSTGRLVFVVTNQPVVARGLASADDVRQAHARLGQALALEGASVDAFYFCPHHPNATVAAYRVDCECRKPRPGMLLEASRQWNVDLASSVMVGDRLSDVAAGKRAGCRAGLVKTGQHDAPAIESPDRFDDVTPDFVADDLLAAVEHFGL